MWRRLSRCSLGTQLIMDYGQRWAVWSATRSFADVVSESGSWRTLDIREAPRLPSCLRTSQCQCVFKGGRSDGRAIWAGGHRACYPCTHLHFPPAMISNDPIAIAEAARPLHPLSTEWKLTYGLDILLWTSRDILLRLSVLMMDPAPARGRGYEGTLQALFVAPRRGASSGCWET